jgi:hypothetical protein
MAAPFKEWMLFEILNKLYVYNKIMNYLKLITGGGKPEAHKSER